MEKYLLIILCLFLVTGCTKEEIKEDKPTDVIIEDVEVDTYKDDNPIKVGLYLDGKLVSSIDKPFIDQQDLVVLETYFTNEENIDASNTKSTFNKYYNTYENISDYKIGYEVSFDAEGKHYSKVVKDYDVEFALSPYIYIYLYDDIHQADGAWYSHITEKDYNENTLFTSIKLYVSGWSYQITTPITVKVFTYDSEDDFDEEGNYRGISSHTLVINKK